MQPNQLRALLNKGKTTPYIGILMETGIWPIREKIEYQTKTMYFSQQMKYKMPNTLYTKVRQIADTINVNIDQANIIKTSVWKERCKDRIKAKAERRLKIKVNE